MRSASLLLLAVLTASPSLAVAQAPATSSPPPPADDLASATAGVNGLVTLPSGLRYKVVRSGPSTGVHPEAGDAIKVNYEGRLASGTVFDSSYQRGKPAVMILSRLVPGWMEALPLMRPGDAWTLYLPPALGYGEEGAGPIPPNSVLVFRLELLGVLTAR